MKYKVEKNIEYPTPVMRRKYPFPEMEPGDSFLLDEGITHSQINIVRAVAKKWGKRHDGENFSVRKAGGGRYRCWRLE